MSNSGPGGPVTGSENTVITRETFRIVCDALESGDVEARAKALIEITRAAPWPWTRAR